METIRNALRNNMRQYAMGIALVTLIIFFQILTGRGDITKRIFNGIILTPMNVSNLIQQNMYVLILAMGMLLVILTGYIDLSVGSTLALVGAASAWMIKSLNMPVWAAILAGLLIGVLLGAWQGFWIAKVNIPPFIVTLSGMLVFRGLTNAIMRGQTIAPLPDSYKMWGSDFLPQIKAAETAAGAAEKMLQWPTMAIAGVGVVIYAVMAWRGRARKQKYKFPVSPMWAFILQIALVTAVIAAFSYLLAQYRGAPLVMLIALVLAIIYTFVASKTTLGRHIYAYGGNEKAARLSGINTQRVLFLVYVNMGLLAGVAGIVFTGRLNAAMPTAGNGFELDAIAACYIGGASASGGVGTIFGALIGGLIMGVLNNGMSILGMEVFWQQVIKGLVLLMAVAFDVYSKSKSRRVLAS